MVINLLLKIQEKSKKKNSLLFLSLYFFSLLYLTGYIVKSFLQKIQSKKVDAFVICIGNSIAGGSGKTPTAIAISQYIKDHHYDLPIAFILRGYRGKKSSSKVVIKVDPLHDRAEDVGDEALLLARYQDTYISINRYSAASLAVKNGAKIIIMDDGMQNFLLHKDYSICLFSSNITLSNYYLMPLGILREPLMWTIKRSHDVVFIEDNNKRHLHYDFLIKLQKKFNVDLTKAKVVPSLVTPRTLSYGTKGNFIYEKIYGHCNYIAIVSIAYPEKFLSTLQQLNIKPLKFYSFPDHHCYQKNELAMIYDEALRMNSRIITTMKDFVKIPSQYHYIFDIVEITIVLNQRLLDKITRAINLFYGIRPNSQINKT